ncbi:hypothetical protein [Rhizobium sp. CC-YZS058]|uniref:hypothetical protein n=1 Tax=Rhizobium sp. CC-YZS058 TaxID=3042153 RepID=UPI002B0581D4|nr:hypothetical protein [Rhizobium sp. CC-YZS058]MEA3533322.1 hypothetical protein [Rhizobium sp. CC-YZS058]
MEWKARAWVWADNIVFMLVFGAASVWFGKNGIEIIRNMTIAVLFLFAELGLSRLRRGEQTTPRHLVRLLGSLLLSSVLTGTLLFVVIGGWSGNALDMALIQFVAATFALAVVRVAVFCVRERKRMRT